jgi:hypothetical protein
MLSLEQFLVFEISPDCNLSGGHAPACPSGNPLRWAKVDTSRPIANDLIVDCCRQAYDEMGFRGQVAWHYYCEPMLAWDRLRELMPRIKEEVPDARFCLWTNGTRMPADLSELKIFDTIWVSNYRRTKWDFLRQHVADMHVLGGVFDTRTDGSTRISGSRCLRPFNEFILDHYGNGRLCCMDWRAKVPLGNVWEVRLRSIVERFVAIRNKIMWTPIDENAPAVCRACAYRQSDAARLVDPIFREIERYAGR